MQMSDDGFWRPHVRAPFVTRDSAVILISYIGLVEQTAAFKRAAEDAGFDVRDQVLWRIRRGEIRQLHGWRRAALSFVRKSGLINPLYRLYRYGWEGTYQIALRVR